ncbi:MAG: type II toxin-antitoxin system HicA family toxin [Thermodesulfovibrionales bacterium]
MKRRELIRHLERYGCILLREGAKHSCYINLTDTSKSTTIPRHAEISDLLVIKICRQLGIPTPK